MKRLVKQYIEQNHLLKAGAKVIVGFSGGADSIVLLTLLKDLGYECLAAHCNFHLRGEESMRDEKFAKEFAIRLGVSFFKQDYDTFYVAKERGISIEMAARDLRYDWFEQLRVEWEAEAIAVAHHQNDSLETMLLNLIRGTGIAGLTGINERNVYVIRPLLCVSREMIEDYAKQYSISYVTDSTNLEDEYTRNKIRNQVLPLLKTMNPNVQSSLLHTMDNMKEVNKVYTFYINQAKETVFDKGHGTIDIKQLLAFPSPESLLFEILKEYGFNKDVIADVYKALNSQSGKEFYSKHYRLVKDREYLILSKIDNEQSDSYLIHKDDVKIDAPFLLEMEFLVCDSDIRIVKDNHLAYFDADKLKFPLVLRKWEKGDWFIPFGMEGKQKLSDYFNNNKFNKLQKDNTWVLCSEQSIVWIVGYRTDNRYKIHNKTQNICVFKLS